MKIKSLIVSAALALGFIASVNAQTIAGTAAPAYNSIPGNEGTAIVVPLLTTNRIPASTTSNVLTRALELPANRDVGLLVNGFIVTNNAQFSLNYQLSPDGTRWTWPPTSLSSGVVASNTTPAFGAFLVLSNSATYPARFWRVYSVTAGTNSLFVSNVVFFYKNSAR